MNEKKIWVLLKSMSLAGYSVGTDINVVDGFLEVSCDAKW